MKRAFIIFLSIATLTLTASTCKQEYVELEPMELGDEFYAPDRLLIMYDEKIGKEPLLAAIKEYNAEILYDYSIIPGMAIKIPEGADIHEAMAYFKKVKGVVSVERDQIIRLTDPVQPRIEVM